MTKSKHEVILVTVRGFDAPGITAGLTEVIARSSGVRIIDIEQTVVHRKLILSILLEFDHGRVEKTSVLKELLFRAKEIGVQLDFEAFDRSFLDGVENGHQYAITCLGHDVGAEPLSRISAALAKRDVNIIKIAKLTQNSLSCVELLVEAPVKLKHHTFAKELLELAGDIDIDLAIQPADLSRRAKRLVVMDMDSTLVASEAIDELARRAGVFKKVVVLTKQAMEGRLDYQKSLRQRVALLKGLPVEVVDEVVRKTKLNRGAERLLSVLKHLGYKIAVISGGFTPFAEYLKEKLEIDFAFANQLEVVDGKLTGNLVGRIIDGPGKAMLLETVAQGERISLDQVIAIGDGANDLPMLSRAGMGIAFHAKEIVRKEAHTSIGTHAGLDSLLYLLGIREREVNQGVIHQGVKS